MAHGCDVTTIRISLLLGQFGWSQLNTIRRNFIVSCGKWALGTNVLPPYYGTSDFDQLDLQCSLDFSPEDGRNVCSETPRQSARYNCDSQRHQFIACRIWPCHTFRTATQARPRWARVPTPRGARGLPQYRRSHHHHVPEGLGVFPVPWSSIWSWSLHLFLGRPMFLRPFGLYCSACFGSLFVSILCTCCSHFFWYCFISFVMFCASVFCQIYWFFFLNLVLLFQVSVSKISSVLLLNVVPLFSSVPKLHFQISMLR